MAEEPKSNIQRIADQSLLLHQLSLKWDSLVNVNYHVKSDDDEEKENLSVGCEHIKVGRVSHGEVVVVVLGFSTSSKDTHHLLSNE